MEKKKTLPNNFFEKYRTNNVPSKQTEVEIYPIKWSKEVMDGKKEVVVSLPKKK